MAIDIVVGKKYAHTNEDSESTFTITHRFGNVFLGKHNDGATVYLFDKEGKALAYAGMHGSLVDNLGWGIREIPPPDVYDFKMIHQDGYVDKYWSIHPYLTNTALGVICRKNAQDFSLISVDEAVSLGAKKI